MKEFTALDIIMAIPIGLIVISVLVGVLSMITREFMVSTWTDILAGLLAVWATVAVVYFIVRSSI